MASELQPVRQGHRKSSSPEARRAAAGSLGRARPLGGREGAARKAPRRPRARPLPRAEALRGAAPVTQHLAGSGRGGGVAGSLSGAPRARHRGLRPGPCLLLEVDGALHRTVALQHAHGLHRHASPGHARRPRETWRSARTASDATRRRRKRRRKPRRRRRGAFIGPRLATPTLARNQSAPAGSAHR